MGTTILRLISLLLKQHLWLLLLFCGITGLLQAQSVAPLHLDANVLESACAGNGHVISVKVKGGEAPYTYSWQDGFQGSFRKDLASGTYSCTVRDSNGAVATKQFNFKPQPAALELNYKQKRVGEINVIEVEAKGGKAPYNYLWIGKGIDIEASRDKYRMDGLASGVYQVIVQDANECANSITVNVQ